MYNLILKIRLMIQFLRDIIKDNFPLLLSVFERRPFVILSGLFLATSIVLGILWWNVNDEKNKNTIQYIQDLDSVKRELHQVQLELNECKKNDNFNGVIDSTIKTLLIEKLLK